MHCAISLIRIKILCQFFVPEWVERYGFNGGDSHDKRNYPTLKSLSTDSLPLKFKKGERKPVAQIVQNAFEKEVLMCQETFEQEVIKCQNEQKEFITKNENVFLQEADYKPLLQSLKNAEERFSQLIIETKKLHEEVKNATLLT